MCLSTSFLLVLEGSFHVFHVIIIELVHISITVKTLLAQLL